MHPKKFQQPAVALGSGLSRTTDDDETLISTQDTQEGTNTPASKEIRGYGQGY
jgi:hypothetical protein